MKSSTRQSISFYEAEAKTYDERRWQTAAGAYIDSAQKEILLSLVGECEGKNILDVAGGTGRFALELARRGANVTVLDSSENMLDVARSKFEAEGFLNQLSIRKAVATELPFNDGAFDVCICINAMNHIPDYDRVLSEIGRVTSQGGLSVTNYTNWLSYYLPFGVLANLRQKSVTRDVYTKWFRLGEIKLAHTKACLGISELVGAVQFPTKTSNKVFLALYKSLDKVSRRGLLRYVAPMLFVKANKDT